MALAQATSNPALASWSLMVLIVSFNLARCMMFPGRWKRLKDMPHQRAAMTELNALPPWRDPTLSHQTEQRDDVALASAVV